LFHGLVLQKVTAVSFSEALLPGPLSRALF
jgi:hypothetical protein